MLRSCALIALGLVGLFAACSTGDGTEPGSSSGSSNGPAGPGSSTGAGSVPQVTVSGTGDSIIMADGSTVPVMTDTAGNGVARLPDGTVVTVLPSGEVVAGTQSGSGNWDVNVATDACVQVSIGAEGVPALLYFVIDKSTSMNREPESSEPQTKWEATRDALVASWPEMDPSLSVGALFYPNTDDSRSDCLPGCAEDVDALSVPIAPLTPEHVSALQDGTEAVPTRTDIPGTPTHDAWRVGLARLQEALTTAPPQTQGYLVLMTDGMPTLTLNCEESYGCLNDDANASGVSAAEWQDILEDVGNTNVATGIQTFVVGVPGSEDNRDVPEIDGQKDYVPRNMLSALAIAGGTAAPGCSPTGAEPYCHIDMTQTDDFVSSLRQIIGTIAQSVVSCQYTVPEVDIPNVFVNPDDATVNYYLGGAEPPVSLAKSTDACASGEWTYDDSQTQIILCDSACTTARNDPAASIKVDFGCVSPL